MDGVIMWIVELPDGERSAWLSRLAAEQMLDYCGGLIYYQPIGQDW